MAEFAQAGHKADGYEDYRRILERKDVDAVLIATPDHWHSPMTIEAIAAGKDIYCEKPVSNTVEAAVRMRDAARKSNRIIQIGTQQRSWTHFMEAAKLFQDGYIGTTVRHIVMSPPGGGGGGGGAGHAAADRGADAGRADSGGVQLGSLSGTGAASAVPRGAARLARLVRVRRRRRDRLGRAPRRRHGLVHEAR